MAALLLFNKPVGFVAILGILALLRISPAMPSLELIRSPRCVFRTQVAANDFEPTLSDRLAFARVIAS